MPDIPHIVAVNQTASRPFKTGVKRVATTVCIHDFRGISAAAALRGIAGVVRLTCQTYKQTELFNRPACQAGVCSVIGVPRVACNPAETYAAQKT